MSIILNWKCSLDIGMIFSQLLNSPILHCTVNKGNRVYETNATEMDTGNSKWTSDVQLRFFFLDSYKKTRLLYCKIRSKSCKID